MSGCYSTYNGTETGGYHGTPTRAKQPSKLQHHQGYHKGDTEEREWAKPPTPGQKGDCDMNYHYRKK